MGNTAPDSVPDSRFRWRLRCLQLRHVPPYHTPQRKNTDARAGQRECTLKQKTTAQTVLDHTRPTHAHSWTHTQQTHTQACIHTCTHSHHLLPLSTCPPIQNHTATPKHRHGIPHPGRAEHPEAPTHSPQLRHLNEHASGQCATQGIVIQRKDPDATRDAPINNRQRGKERCQHGER